MAGLHTCTIITGKPNEFGREIHTRMPVSRLNLSSSTPRPMPFFVTMLITLFAGGSGNLG
jgi:hypothetical protein